MEFRFLRLSSRQYSFKRSPEVEPRDFTSDLYIRLDALYAQ